MRKDSGEVPSIIRPVLCDAASFFCRGGGDALRDPMLGRGGGDARRDPKTDHTHRLESQGLDSYRLRGCPGSSDRAPGQTYVSKSCLQIHRFRFLELFLPPAPGIWTYVVSEMARSEVRMSSLQCLRGLDKDEMLSVPAAAPRLRNLEFNQNVHLKYKGERNCGKFSNVKFCGAIGLLKFELSRRGSQRSPRSRADGGASRRGSKKVVGSRGGRKLSMALTPGGTRLGRPAAVCSPWRDMWPKPMGNRSISEIVQLARGARSGDVDCEDGGGEVFDVGCAGKAVGALISAKVCVRGIAS